MNIKIATLIPLTLLALPEHAHAAYKGEIYRSYEGERTYTYITNLNIERPAQLRLHNTDTRSGWAWDVIEVNIYTSADCQAQRVHRYSISDINDSHSIADTNPIYDRYKPESAFDGKYRSLWGGRREPGSQNNAFWLSMAVDRSDNNQNTIKCIELVEYTDRHDATNLSLQIKKDQQWQTWVEEF